MRELPTHHPLGPLLLVHYPPTHQSKLPLVLELTLRSPLSKGSYYRNRQASETPSNILEYLFSEYRESRELGESTSILLCTE